MARFNENAPVRFQALPRVVVATDQSGTSYSLSPETVMHYMKEWGNRALIKEVLPSSGGEQQYRVEFVGGAPNQNVIIFSANLGEACLAPVDGGWSVRHEAPTGSQRAKRRSAISMDQATARAALAHVSKAVDAQRREYIMSCLLQIREGEDPVVSMCAAGHDDQTELMRFLIEKCQGDVNHKDKTGGTQLHAVARSGYPETVKLFLKYARDVNARDNDGMTPLMCCAETGREFITYKQNGRNMYGPYGKPDGHIETIRLLRQAGADVNARNSKGATAADIAAEKKFSDILAALSGAADVPSRSENKKSGGFFRRLFGGWPNP